MEAKASDEDPPPPPRAITFSSLFELSDRFDEDLFLITYISLEGSESWGNSIAGGKMKSTGYDFWIEPNLGATNETGFSVFPGGAIDQNNGNSHGINTYGVFWAPINQTDFSYRQFNYNQEKLSKFIDDR